MQWLSEYYAKIHLHKLRGKKYAEFAQLFLVGQKQPRLNISGIVTAYKNVCRANMRSSNSILIRAESTQRKRSAFG